MAREQYEWNKIECNWIFFLRVYVLQRSHSMLLEDTFDDHEDGKGDPHKMTHISENTTK